MWRSAATTRKTLFIPDNPKVAEQLEKFIPEYDKSNKWFPTSVCESCHRYFSPSYSNKSDKIKIASELLDFTQNRRSPALMTLCETSGVCLICNNSNAAPVCKPKEMQTSEHEFKSLPPPTRAKRHFYTSTQSPSKDSGNLVCDDYLAMGRSQNASGRQVAAAVGAMRNRESDGLTTVSSPNPHTFRKLHSELNNTFAAEFHTIECPELEGKIDGSAIKCKDLRDFLLKVIWIRGRAVSDVAYIKVNADDGRGSLKLMIQILFTDDPLLTELPEETRREYADENNGYLDSGVNGVYIVVLIPGCDETFASVRFMFNSLNFEDVCETFPNAQIVLPVDMKMQNKTCGIQGHSARYPLVYNHWSQRAEYSKPDEIRTAQTISDSNKARLNSKDDNPINFHSVAEYPIHLLSILPEKNLIQVLVPCQLHLLLGITKSLVTFLQILDRELLDNWLFTIKVKRDPRHGPDSTDFKGNECRKIIHSTDQLEMLIPEQHRKEPRVSTRISKSASSVDTKSNQDPVNKYKLIRLLIKCMISFSNVVSFTMRPSLNPQWSEAIDQFSDDFDVFSTPYLQSFSRRSGTELTTPKIRVLTHEMRQWISTNKCSLSRISEQPFETIHKSFLNFSSQYSIPNTGVENKSPSPASSSSSSSAKQHTPSLDTRQSKSKLPAKSKGARQRKSTPQPHKWPVLPSQASLKRSALKELQNRKPTKSSKVHSKASSSQAHTRFVGNIKYARERRLHAVIGYNQSHHPLNPECIARMKIDVKIKL